jgi:hypothetical protein
MPVSLVSSRSLDQDGSENSKWKMAYSGKVGDRSTEDVIAGETLGDGNSSVVCVRVFKPLLPAVS